MDKHKLNFDDLNEIADLLDQALVVYSVTDNKVTYTNQLATELLGLRKNATWNDLQTLLPKIPTHDRLYINDRFNDLQSQQVIRNVEVRIVKNNTPHLLCFNAYYLQNRSSIIILINDITRSKAYENYLVEFGTRKNTLLDMLAHQMSGALSLALNLSSAAQKISDRDGDLNLKKYLHLMNENAKRCIETIHDLMKREHDASPTVSVRFTRTNIVEKVGFVIEEIQASHTDRKITFFCEASEVFIETDEIKALQIVTNLLSNAIKFTSPDKQIKLVIQEHDTFVVILVEDHGIGIPEDSKPSIFDPHGRAGRTGLNGEESIGLGLSICAELATLLKGKIWFESTEGIGSTFYLSLPKQKPT